MMVINSGNFCFAYTKKGLLLRQVAAELEVDTAYISKMEKGEKNINKEYMVQLAKLCEYDENELITFWLADKLFDTVKGESMALKAIDIVQKHLKKI